VAQYVRHCATRRKVAGSMAEKVNGNFHWHKTSGRTMALGLTEPLREMITRNIPEVLRWTVRRADNLTAFMCRLSWNLGASTFWNPPGLSSPITGLLIPVLEERRHFRRNPLIGHQFFHADGQARSFSEFWYTSTAKCCLMEAILLQKM
jgi:hypothetical protein